MSDNIFTATSELYEGLADVMITALSLDDESEYPRISASIGTDNAVVNLDCNIAATIQRSKEDWGTERIIKDIKFFSVSLTIQRVDSEDAVENDISMDELRNHLLNRVF